MLSSVDHSSLQAILVFLAAGIAGIAVAKLLRVSVILGFFAAGAAIGPHGLHLLDEQGTIAVLAELGVAFLLFDVGTHLSFRKLWDQRRELFGLGAAQVGATTAIVAAFALLLGVDLRAALILGAGLSLSSTALVLQTLKDRREGGSPLERKAVALLVFQDLFVVLLLVLLPALGGESDSSALTALLLALGKVAIALVAVAVIGRFLLQPVFRWITATKNDELFTFAALGFVIAVAFGAGALGLSLPLGAFLGGLVLSESRYSYLIQAEVAPFRGLLLSLFFLSVGMSLALEVFVDSPLLVAGLAAALIACKSAALWGVGRLLGFGRGFALRLGLTLSQGSEFTFVLVGLAATVGLLESSLVSLVGATVSVTLALTPLLAKLGAALAAASEQPPADGDSSECDNCGKVVLVGFDDTSAALARILVAAGVDYVAFTSDRDVVARARCQGFDVQFGSPDRPRALGMATVGEAAAVVVNVADNGVARTIVNAVRKVNAKLSVYAATRDPAFFEELSRMELEDVLIANDNTAHEIGRQVLLRLGRARSDVDAFLEQHLASAERDELVPAAE